MRKVGMFLLVAAVLLASGYSRRSSESAEQFPDPLIADPEHWRLEFENERVRVTRAKVEPREVERMHQHSLPAVVVYLTDQDIQRTLPDGTTAKVHINAGVRWVEPNAHRVENLADKPFELIRIDLKPLAR
jgi:hypothetical protein